jgi:hypothetical protein
MVKTINRKVNEVTQREAKPEIVDFNLAKLCVRCGEL